MNLKRKIIMLTAVLAVVPTGALFAQDDFNWTGTVASGDWVDIRNIVGSVNVEPTSGSEVIIAATKSGRSRDFDLVDIVLEETRDGIVVCVLYPQRTRRGRRDRARDEDQRSRDGCRRGSHDRDTDEADVEVDFEIQIPTGVNIRSATVSGDVDVRGVAADVEAVSVSGDIYVSTSGYAEANTVSGSIEAHLGRIDWSGELSFRTVSGDVRVYVPEGLNADVSFNSVTGDMESDFPIQIRRRAGFMAGSLRGTIGDGGRDLEINTVSGDAMLLIEP